MRKTTLFISGLCLSCLAAALPASAQEPATLVMRSGDRISGELVDLGGVGFTIRVNGQDRQVDPNQVAAVEFTPGGPSADARSRLLAGRPVVVLRNGQVIEGTLFDIGGTHPLRVTLNTPGGQRDFTSSDIAQIFYSDSGAVGTAGAVAQEVPPGDIRVEANRPWTDTGISVRRGERVIFNSTGNINLAEGLSAGVKGTSATSSANYKVRKASGANLIGRVDQSATFDSD